MVGFSGSDTNNQGNGAARWRAKITLGRLIAFFAALFWFGFVAHGANSPRYLGLFLSLFLFLPFVILNFSCVRLEMLRLFKNESILVWLSLSVVLVMLISTCMHFLSGVKILFFDLFPVIMVGIIVVSLPPDDKVVLSRWLFFLMIMALLNDLLKYGWSTYIHYSEIGRFDRNFNQYSVLISPFLLGYLLLEDVQRYRKYIVAMFLGVPTLIALLWTGQRGAWGAIFLEAILVFLFSINARKSMTKKTIVLGIFGIIFIVLVSAIFYQTNSNFKSKIDQGLGGSGRSQIISTRLPVFLEHGDLVFGFGYSNEAYNEFFLSNGAPKIFGSRQKNGYQFYQDGPFYLQLFYHFGIFGFLFFVVFSIFFLYRTICASRGSNSAYIGTINACLTASFFGYFLAGGLFEGRSINFMFFLLFFYFVVNSRSAEGALAGTLHKQLDDAQ